MGTSVKIFLVDGVATGILTAEIGNWTGHVLSSPRTRIEDAIRRPELARTGVYFLIGQDYNDQEIQVYVGEGDDVRTRIIQHSKDENKDFWERFISVTSKDLNLTKAHVKFLEAHLVARLDSAKKCELVNKTKPGYDLLPEAERSDMLAFLEHIELLLPVLGFNGLSKPKVVEQSSDIASPEFYVVNEKKGIDARATEINGEFIIRAGAKGSLQTGTSVAGNQRALRDQSLNNGKIERLDDKVFITREDLVFNSPSGAASFLFGTARNGRIAWTESSTNKSYADWQDSQLDNLFSNQD